MRSLWKALATGALAIGAACASGGAGSTTGVRAAPSRDRNVLTLEDLERVAASNMYDAVRTLRPEWLRVQPTIIRSGAEGSVLVYLDGVQYGDPSALRQISVGVVQEVRYLSAPEAQARYGTQDLHGVIAVTTRHR
jgi:hypothetical protein